MPLEFDAWCHVCLLSQTKTHTFGPCDTRSVEVPHVAELVGIDDAVDGMDALAVALDRDDANHLTDHPNAETRLTVDERQMKRRAIAIEALLKADDQLDQALSADNRAWRRRHTAAAIWSTWRRARTARTAPARLVPPRLWRTV